MSKGRIKVCESRWILNVIGFERSPKVSGIEGN